MQPILDRYVGGCAASCEARGFRRDFLVMNGNGGMVSARLVAREAAKTVMSGPASGVMAAADDRGAPGIANAITYDMGGTSTDVALIRGGVPQVSNEIEHRIWPCRSTCRWSTCRRVGAGGGSIARIDAAGLLAGRAGERRAPIRGPICYGRGGTEPTITDANLVLGRLDPAPAARRVAGR